MKKLKLRSETALCMGQVIPSWKLWYRTTIKMISPQKWQVILRNICLQDQDLKHLPLRQFKEY